MKKTKKNQTIPTEELFLLVKDGQMFLVPKKLLLGLEPLEAELLGLQIRSQQKRQLILDAIIGDHSLNGQKIVDKLEVTLNQMYSQYPWLEQNLTMIENKIFKTSLPKA